MSKINIHINEAFDPKLNETYIGLINIDKPPFHLVTISNLKQFSWEVGKSRIGEPVDSLARHLNRNQTRNIFLRISEDLSILNQVENAYRNCQDAETCLDPINTFLREITKKVNGKPMTVFELMDFLKANSLWDCSFGLNLKVGEIKLKVYDRNTVNQHIERLKMLEPQRS
jgi:hypothetical protein